MILLSKNGRLKIVQIQILLFILWYVEVIHVLYITRSIIIPFLRKVQGIKNDDQSLSPVTPLTFSVVPNPLKCSGTFLIY